MYERFTDRSRQVMQLANQEAQRFKHEYIGTEHVLLGLVAEGSGVAANVLKNLDIDASTIRLEIERILQHGPGGGQVVVGRLPHTPRTKKAIEYAIEEARGLNHQYVGTEHLLLGLLREHEGVAAFVLMNLGLKLEDVREEVLNLLGHNTPPAHVVVDALSTVLNAPAEPTAEQVRLVRDLIERITGQKEAFVTAQQFADAARCLDEVEALGRLLAWYERNREQH